jgi:eukaryotic-like serine/threonine-protein kinase
MHTGPADSETIAGVREGEILAGKYRVETILGVGGMGVVVAARHLQLQTKVAIKFLRPEMLASEEAVARFAREARAAVRIMSEHVARVLDVGALENGAPYIVMEFLEGGDLAAWLRQRGPLPVEQAVDFVLQACEAIAEAHALGIVHRDLKPANLFCIRGTDGLLSIKVLDFGISKVSDGDSASTASVTQTSTILGSPLYMSPEQMQVTRDVDVRTDIWALGVILYELLTQRAPFVGETFADICIRIASRPPTPLHELRPDVPDGLGAVILRCLEKDRAARYANVAEMARALVRFGPERGRVSYDRITRVIQAAGLSTGVVAQPPSADLAGQPSPGGTIAAMGRTTRGVGAKKAVFAIGAGALLITGIVGVTAVGLVRLVRPTPGISASAAGGGASAASAPASSVSTGLATPDDPLPSPPGTASVAPSADELAVPAPEAASPETPSPAPVASHGTVRPMAPVRPPVPAVPPVAHSAVVVPSAKPNCDPNFSLDEQGQKHFKPECF